MLLHNHGRSSLNHLCTFLSPGKIVKSWYKKSGPCKKQGLFRLPLFIPLISFLFFLVVLKQLKQLWNCIMKAICPLRSKKGLLEMLFVLPTFLNGQCFPAQLRCYAVLGWLINLMESFCSMLWKFTAKILSWESRDLQHASEYIFYFTLRASAVFYCAIYTTIKEGVCCFHSMQDYCCFWWGFLTTAAEYFPHFL